MNGYEFIAWIAVFYYAILSYHGWRLPARVQATMEASGLILIAGWMLVRKYGISYLPDLDALLSVIPAAN